MRMGEGYALAIKRSKPGKGVDWVWSAGGGYISQQVLPCQYEDRLRITRTQLNIDFPDLNNRKIQYGILKDKHNHDRTPSISAHPSKDRSISGVSVLTDSFVCEGCGSSSLLEQWGFARINDIHNDGVRTHPVPWDLADNSMSHDHLNSSWRWKVWESIITFLYSSCYSPFAGSPTAKVK